MSSAIVQPVVLNFLRLAAKPISACNVVGGGLSGADIYRVCLSDNSQWCVRAWPTGFEAEARLPLVFQALQYAFQAGCKFVPVPELSSDGRPYVAFQSRAWEVTPWLSGQPPTEKSLSHRQVESAMRSLARLHLAWREFQSTTGPVPGLLERKQKLGRLSERRLSEIEQRLPLFIDRTCAELGQRLISGIRRHLGGVQGELTAMSHLSQRLHPVIRDVKRDHLLFAEDELVGMVDFGTLRIDHFSLDLARLLGSLELETGGDWSLARAAYESVTGPLSQVEWSLVQVVDRATVVGAAANWLNWLFIEERDFDDSILVLQRLQQLVRRMDEW